MTGFMITGVAPIHPEFAASEPVFHRETRSFYCYPSSEQLRINALAHEYHNRVDAFDLKHCSGRDRKGNPIPNNTNEYMASTRHAAAVRKEIEAKAYHEGFTRDQLLRAIQNQRP